jgi:DNA (cytosine-5)-methyltransferase 1
MIKKKLEKKYSPRVLDLFAGAGGLSEGFVHAGCEIVGHIEMDKDSCDTLITRMMYHALLKIGKFDEYQNYVLGNITRDEIIEKYGLQNERDSVICAKIGDKNYKELISEIKKRLNGERLDIIVGGPPCQAYSHIGRAVDDKNMRWDSRKFLYRYYLEFLKALKPKIFVFENVPGLQTSGKGKYLREMRKLMKDAGYETDYRVLNTADFGVPQNRRRVILVGWNKESKLKATQSFPCVPANMLSVIFLLTFPKLNPDLEKKSSKDFLLPASCLRIWR